MPLRLPRYDVTVKQWIAADSVDFLEKLMVNSVNMDHHGSALMSCLPHLASSHLFGCRMLTLTNTSEVVGGLVGW